MLRTSNHGFTITRDGATGEPGGLIRFGFSIDVGVLCRYWSDKDNRALVESEFPDFLPTYDGYEHNIQRADAVRYMIMHKFGGVYADLDFESVRPLDELLIRTTAQVNDTYPFQNISSSNNSSNGSSNSCTADSLLLGVGVFFGEEPLAHSQLLENKPNNEGHMACNAFLASTAGHPFWRLVIALMKVGERSSPPLLSSMHA